MNTPPNHELHVHLYGCLTAEDIFTLGRDRWQEKSDRLTWYAEESLRLRGYRPRFEDYWTKSDGFDLLRHDYEMLYPGPFSHFQAGFNLLIALFPLIPNNTEILKYILRQQRDLGLAYGEYRIIIPPHFTAEQSIEYILTFARGTQEIEAESRGQFCPRLAFSLSRDPQTFETQFTQLQVALAMSPERHCIVAIDLCGQEEGHPPRSLAKSLQLVHKHNRDPKAQKLAILYHVGESFTDMTQMSAIRWIAEAASLGAHRLGHALALGVHPSVYLKQPINESANESSSESTQPNPKDFIQLRNQESVAERLDHLHWLLENASMLANHGYKVDQPALQKELSILAESPTSHLISIAANRDSIELTALLQHAILTHLSESNQVIECCPTSNSRIGQITDPAHHPLQTFAKYPELNLIISSDDPGTFRTSLAQEWQIAKSVHGLSSKELTRIRQCTFESSAQQLLFN